MSPPDPIPADRTADTTGDDRDLQARFHSLHYQRHNQRRQEHLATLALPIAGRRVLEVGAGIGDHSGFFLDRGCALTVTEARPRSVALLRRRFPDATVLRLDLDRPGDTLTERFDVVYAYGVLYHLARPAEALTWLAARCDDLLLLETCVLPGDDDRIVFFDEPPDAAENSVSGRGCRPTRAWVRRELGRHFAHVYVPRTQPWHEEFPLDWTRAPENPFLVRSVFVASRRPLNDERLVEGLLARQERGG